MRGHSTRWRRSTAARTGCDAYREIIRIAATRMKPGAPLVLEIGHDQRIAVLALLEVAGFAETAHWRDLGGNDRCVMGRAPGPAC